LLDYYLRGVRMLDVAREVGLCESRVSQMLPSIVALLREKADLLGIVA
jgi:hypothetical protein